MEAFRSFGRFHCPMCFCQREFVSFEEDCTDAGKAECCECGYSFGNRTDELAIEGEGAHQRYVPKTEPVLSRALVERARVNMLEDYNRTMLASGVRREVVVSGASKTANRR